MSLAQFRKSPKKSAIAALVLFAAMTALACQVPVFRYALERWESDPYLIVVRLPENSSDAAKQTVKNLLEAQNDEAGPNVAIHVFDDKPDAEALEKMPESVRMLAQGTTPTMSVFYPAPAGLKLPPVWSGALTPDAASQTLDSPLRQKIAKKLLQGESAVWVLVESGNKADDDKAEAALNAALKKLAAEIKLPEGVVLEEDVEKATGFIDPEDILEANVPLKIAFSTVRMSRKDAKEAAFLGMLLNSESDLGEYVDKPMAFPIFGRGRALYALVGAGITEDNVAEACIYLTSACSCQVKAQNPGIDLLMNVDWETAMAGSDVMEEKALPPLVGVGELTEDAEQPKTEAPVTANALADTTPTEAPRSSIMTLLMTVAIGIFIALAAGTWFLMRADK